MGFMFPRLACLSYYFFSPQNPERLVLSDLGCRKKRISLGRLHAARCAASAIADEKDLAC